MAQVMNGVKNVAAPSEGYKGPGRAGPLDTSTRIVEFPRSTFRKERPVRASFESRMKSGSNACSDAMAFKSRPRGSTAEITAQRSSAFWGGIGGEDVVADVEEVGRLLGVPSPGFVSGCADVGFGRLLGVPSPEVKSGCADGGFGRLLGVPSPAIESDSTGTGRLEKSASEMLKMTPSAESDAEAEGEELGRERASATELALPSR